MFNKLLDILSGVLFINELLCFLLLIGLYITTLKCIQTYQFIKGMKKSKRINTGIYHGYRVNPKNNVVSHEVLNIKRTLKGFSIHPIYSHKKAHHYSLTLNQNASHRMTYDAKFNKGKEHLYSGPAVLEYLSHEEAFKGVWLGASQQGETNGGEWYLKHYKNSNLYLTSPFVRKFSHIWENLIPKGKLINDIVEKHSQVKEKVINVDGVTLKLGQGSFNPHLGKISKSLPRLAKHYINKDSKILELGYGSGYYSIYLAKETGCQVVGVDISDELKQRAEENSSENDTSELTDFRVCNMDDLYSCIDDNEKFDLIIANLPFSQRKHTTQSISSPFYYCFTGNPQLLEQLMLGASHHVKVDGKMIFSFGESGYIDLFNDLLDISAWGDLECISKLEEKNDTFYVYLTELNKTIKDKHKEAQRLSTAFDVKADLLKVAV